MVPLLQLLPCGRTETEKARYVAGKPLKFSAFLDRISVEIFLIYQCKLNF